MYIAVTGYFGSGSSAVLDLLSEYRCNGTGLIEDKGGYEHNTLYFPGGIFDLEDKLLKNNDIHRSDEALATFKREMMRLNNNNFGWYGSFRELFGNQFEKNLNQFIDDLHPFNIGVRYYGQCEKVIFNPLKIPVQLAAKILVGRNIYKWGRQFVYNSVKPGMTVAFPSDEEFYTAAKRFVKAYLEMYREPGKGNIVFDRLLLCHNLYRIPHYFDDDFRIIRMQRDIRDVYIFNKYLWKEIHAGSMYPFEIDTFVDYWRRVNACEQPSDDYRILTVSFEDLIYNYEETVERIEKHCSLKPEDRTAFKSFFDPAKSIKNTQVYRISDKWKDEINRLEKEFSEYTYQFPYEIETSISDMFDDSRVKKKKGLLNVIRRI
ncbi:sulfotransferase domain-containing protein [Oribacterium sp. FC2011]|uniref:sulfotransferase domain-containing protein n=1 Tax=Oribacterium sp. FC2011 TaxID=1408311 RepID=UPI0004E1827E|nr:sulfotransferase domain-containing protein [Oribacterium sp. FC2011]